jgi:hypothetical protein
VRFNNGGVFSDPVLCEISAGSYLPPTGTVPTPVISYMLDGATRIRGGAYFNQTYSTGSGLNTTNANPYTAFTARAGSLSYTYAGGSSHAFSGQFFDSNGELISGDARWGATRI